MDAANLRESLNTSLQTLGTEAAARLPGLIVALLLLIAGWIIARIARSAVPAAKPLGAQSISRRQSTKASALAAPVCMRTSGFIAGRAAGGCNSPRPRAPC